MEKHVGVATGARLMKREVKRVLSLHRYKYIGDLQLFNWFIDIAAGGDVEGVMASIPPEFLPRFRDWIDRLLPSLDTLLNLKTGPLSEHEKDTFRAIHDWLDRHLIEPQPHEAADSSPNGPSDAASSHPVAHRG